MKLVDTNIFVYAVGRPHEYKKHCLRLVAELERGEYDANVDTELLQEVLYHFWKRGRHREGLQMFDRLTAGFPDPFPITLTESRVAREILSRRPDLEPRDAIHVAVVLVHGLEGIISTDRAFDAIPEIIRFDPKDL